MPLRSCGLLALVGDERIEEQVAFLRVDCDQGEASDIVAQASGIGALVQWMLNSGKAVAKNEGTLFGLNRIGMAERRITGFAGMLRVIVGLRWAATVARHCRFHAVDCATGQSMRA